jgi:hypothetical protein
MFLDNSDNIANEVTKVIPCVSHDDSGHGFTRGKCFNKPSLASLINFRKVHPELFKGNSGGDAKSRYGFNWLDIDTYLANWKILSPDMQYALREFIRSDLKGNCYRWGHKDTSNFEKHLLLMIGSEIWAIKPYPGSNLVLSNLKRNNQYNRVWTRCRLIDGKTCRHAARKFDRERNFRWMFQHFDAQVILFESGKSYREVPEVTIEYRDRVKAFFRANVDFLKKNQKRTGVYSYIYSHEISCDSILRMEFRPHTHAVVFFPKGTPPPDLKSIFTHKDSELNEKKRIHTSYATIKKFIAYMLKAYSLAAVYERERRDDNLKELNTQTVQAWRVLFESAGAAYGERAYKRSGHSYVPKKSEKDFHHPLLKRNGRARRKSSISDGAIKAG